MRILIHTRYGVWSIGSRGIERVHTLDWKRASEAFEALHRVQVAKIVDANDNEYGKLIDDTVEAGTISAPRNDSAWRALDDNRAPQHAVTEQQG